MDMTPPPAKHTNQTKSLSSLAARLDARRSPPRCTVRAVLKARKLRQRYLIQLRPHLEVMLEHARECARLKRAFHREADALLGDDEARYEAGVAVDVDVDGTFEAQQCREELEWPRHAALEDIEASLELYWRAADRMRDGFDAAPTRVPPKLPREPDVDQIATDDELTDEEALDAPGHAALAAWRGAQADERERADIAPDSSDEDSDDVDDAVDSDDEAFPRPYVLADLP